MNSNKTLKALFTAFAALLVFASVATAAAINDDDIGHFLKGTNSADTINGNGGNDTINAKKGADTIDGGLGDDRILASKGNDTVNGGDGNDTLHGGWGNDVQHGGAGDDIIFANRGRDTSYGDDGNDQLWALARGDVHSRHDYRGDTLIGGNGNDTFRTRDGEGDRIDCGDGDDVAVLDWKDKIVDATSGNPNGSCEHVFRKKRAASDKQENANP
jgi:Ca2+-binding RTX toxin-like protein